MKKQKDGSSPSSRLSPIRNNQITLKLMIAGIDAPKLWNFSSSISVERVCQEICERLSAAELAIVKRRLNVHSWTQMCLSKANRWLRPQFSLNDERLRDWDVVELKSRLLKLRFHISDMTPHETAVDCLIPASEVTADVCRKFNLNFFEEYGLMRRSDVSFSSPTSSLRRRKSSTSYEWIDPRHPLKRYSFEEGTEIFIRRRFFFNDHLVDSGTPSDLILLYTHCRNQVMNLNFFPMTLDTAVTLAGLQCQVLLGDHNPDGEERVSIVKFLPKKYAKMRVEKRVAQEHLKHAGLCESDAQLAYIDACRVSFPDSYGFSFFVVKERVQGKQKLIARLLGVSKDPILRMDVKTRQVIQSWSLTHLRRWGASQKTFTLDFGDYAEFYYSVQTNEADDLAYTISTYIDLNMKHCRKVEQQLSPVPVAASTAIDVTDTGVVDEPPEPPPIPFFSLVNRIQQTIHEIAASFSAVDNGNDAQEFVREVCTSCVRLCVAYPNPTKVESELNALSTQLLMASEWNAGGEVALAARGLCRALSDLVEAVALGTNNQTSHKSVFEKANHLASQINNLEPTSSTSSSSSSSIITDARLLAQTVANLVMKAKQEPSLVSTATSLTLAVSRLLACTKLANIAASPRANDMIVECCDRVLRCSQILCQNNYESELEAINQCVDSLKLNLAFESSADLVDEILHSLHKIRIGECNSLSTIKELIVRLVSALRQKAKSSSTAKYSAIIEDARLLAETVEHLLTDARHPDFQKRCGAFQSAVIRASTWLTAVDESGWINEMYSTCRETVSASVRLVSLIQRHEPLNEARLVTTLIPMLSKSAKSCLEEPSDTRAQDEFLNIIGEFVRCGVALCEAAISPRTRVLADDLLVHLKELESGRDKVIERLKTKTLPETLQTMSEVCGELDRGLASSTCTDYAIHSPSNFIRAFAKLRKVADETVQSSATYPITSISMLTSSIQATYQACEQMAPTTGSPIDPTTFGFICQRTADAIHAIRNLISRIFMCSEEGDRVDVDDILSEAMDDCVSMLPGHRELVEAISRINQFVSERHRMLMQHRRCSGTSHQTLPLLLVSLNRDTDELSKAMYRLASTIHSSSSDIPVDPFTLAFDRLVENSLSSSEDLFPTKLQKLSLQLHRVHSSSLALLDNARSIYVERIVLSTRCEKSLAPYCAQLTDRLNELVHMAVLSCADASICDYALDRLRHARSSACRRPLGPVNEMTFAQAYERVIRDANELSDAVTRIIGAARTAANCTPRSIATTTSVAQQVSDTACGLVEGASQIAYLIATHQDGCVRGEPGLVDQFTFHKCQSLIEKALHELFKCTDESQDIDRYLRTLSVFTCLICNAARRAAARTWILSVTEVSSVSFVNCSAEVANGTFTLIAEVQSVIGAGKASCYERMQGCRQIATKLLTDTATLCSYATSKKFSLIPATMSAPGISIQKSLMEAVGVLVDGTTSLIESLIKYGCYGHDDGEESYIDEHDRDSVWHQFSLSTRQISAGIQSLVQHIRESAGDLLNSKNVSLDSRNEGDEEDELNLLEQIQQLQLTDLVEETPQSTKSLIELILYKTLLIYEQIKQLCIFKDLEEGGKTESSTSSKQFTYVSTLKSVLKTALSIDARLEGNRQKPSAIVRQADIVIRTSSEYISAIVDDERTGRDERSIKADRHVSAIEDLISVIQEQLDDSNDEQCSNNPDVNPPSNDISAINHHDTFRSSLLADKRVLHVSEDGSVSSIESNIYTDKVTASAGTQIDSCSKDISKALDDMLTNVE